MSFRSDVTVLPGDCTEVLRTLEDNSVDSCVTDPPYALVSIAKRFGSENAAPAKSDGPTGVYGRASAGFMGKQWDTGETAFHAEFWREVYRVLKPGGHVLSFGGTRTHHRLVCAIEDAGFEIRDTVMWVYGSGFPKSHDVSKGIDKAAGAEREVIGSKLGQPGYSLKANDTETHSRGAYGKYTDAESECAITAPSTPEARQWQGWGTALKPAVEPICLARKPLSEGTIAANVLEHGTGAINVDGCRVDYQSETDQASAKPGGRATAKVGALAGGSQNDSARTEFKADNTKGRWPANLIHDGSDEVIAAFPANAGGGDNRGRGNGSRPGGFGNIGSPNGSDEPCGALYSDSGSAARFFYCAKASKQERLGSKHPTVKPIKLVRYLVRLVTPPGGVVLDPFAGTGTTGQAALEEGFKAILIEREEEYLEDIRRRFGMAVEISKAISL